MTALQQIKTILTPVRLYSVEDFRKVAEIICESINGEALNNGEADSLFLFSQYYELMTRYEEMTRGKLIYEKMDYSKESYPTKDYPLKFKPALLTKEHFVCEVEKPKTFDYFLAVGHERGNPYAENYAKKNDAYEAAKKKCWFEGFEFPPTGKEVFCVTEVGIFIGNAYINYTTDTVHDMLYHLDFYNRTATTPIHITPTDSFVEALIT